MPEKLTIDILGKRTIAFTTILVLFWISAASTLITGLAFGYDTWVYGSFILALALAMVLAVLRNRKVIGQLVLDTHTITHEKAKTYELKNINSLKLVCRDFDGAPPQGFARSIFVAKGSDNKLSFVINGTQHTYRLLLRENQVIPLNALVRQWQEQGVSLYFRNVYGQYAY